MFSVISSVASIVTILITNQIYSHYNGLDYYILMKAISLFSVAIALISVGFSKYISKTLTNLILHGRNSDGCCKIEENDVRFVRSKTGTVITCITWMLVSFFVQYYLVKIGNIVADHSFEINGAIPGGIMLISLFGYLFWRNAVILKIWRLP